VNSYKVSKYNILIFVKIEIEKGILK